ncbi:DUF4190 domain-containing protein [Nocardioides sp.]|uniref:DUF4190 domain-containing protein n=1 Tax=Nocardioides sp. TaxID=35761 RepID=UPI0027270C07|nr:DUF4190 domain-containing protein [Nocardioides sp.]MDO9457215.1 DUF4190 domain-containing protein [Nocardioides sp.]
MSNPYDPNTNPYGSPEQPGGGYGQPGGGYGQPGGGYGGQGGGYGQPNPYGGNEAPKKTDAVSIIGFILSLTCCLSIIGAILGFVGLSRTKGGKRKGRWAALTAVIVGILGTIIAAVGIGFFANYLGSVISVDEAKAGQCINVDTSDDEIIPREADCGEDHDAEIVYAGTADDIDPDFVPADINDITDSAISRVICSANMDEAYVAAIGEDYDWQLVSEDGNPTGTEPYFCYVEPASGQLDKKLQP